MFQDSYDHEVSKLFTFVPVKVAGVSFKNGRRSRQTILRQIMWHDEPYSKTKKVVNLNFHEVVFDNEPAIEVWVQDDNGEYEQIGYIPKDHVPFFIQNWDLYHSSIDFKVYGGGQTPDGTKLSYGASFTLRFNNSSDTQAQYDKYEENQKRLENEAKRKAEEAEKPYKRGFELFKLDYPEFRCTQYFHTTDSTSVSFNILNMDAPKGKQVVCQVIYDPTTDTIDAFYHNGISLPPRAHSKHISKPTSSFSPLKFAFLIFAIAIIAYFCFIKS